MTAYLAWRTQKGGWLPYLETREEYENPSRMISFMVNERSARPGERYFTVMVILIVGTGIAGNSFRDKSNNRSTRLSAVGRYSRFVVFTRPIRGRKARSVDPKKTFSKIKASRPRARSTLPLTK